MSAAPLLGGFDGSEAARLLEEHAGIAVHGQREEELAQTVRERLSATGCDGLDAYRRRFSRPDLRKVEIAALAARLTVGETYFFRDAAQITALVEEVRGGLGQGAPRILSVGCSSGDEAYSIAIALHEALGSAADRAAILGIDLNPSAVERARVARYSAWALRATPEDVRARYFRRDEDGRFTLAQSIKDRVAFAERNVLDADASFWAPGAFDAIVCRNVFIYFGARAIAVALERFAETLPEGGLLFLGSADAIGPIDGPFDAVRAHDLRYFRRRSAPPPRAPLALVAARRPLPRVRAAAVVSDAEPGIDHAATLVARGDFAGAERACREVLARVPACADAHYLIGLCREQAGELVAAVTHFEAAVARDPAFALAHLRLGLIAQRAGDRAAARRAMETARDVMPHEDERRVALFGDGFRREALVDLCAAALEKCRGDDE